MPLQQQRDVTTGETWRRFATPRFQICLAIVLGITIIRLIGLHYSKVDLFVDEAQYWNWSQHLALGYFSKPPLLAWIIAGANAVCGSGESCVRMASPIFWCGTAFVGYATARELYDERTAFWTALAITLAPGVVFSSRIISTDVPLLFFWALALLAFVKLLRGGGWRWTIVLGVSLGLGLLAKYAMIYFLLGIMIVAFTDREARPVLRKKELWLALAIGALLIAPNVIWNAQHRFETFRHTAGLVQTEQGLKLGPGLEFLGAQFGVIGPIIFSGLLALLVRWNSRELRREDRWMLSFAIPPLALITMLAFTSRAYANWAAPSFVSAAIVVSAVLVRKQWWSWLRINIAFGVVIQALILIADASAHRVTVSAFGWSDDPYRRTMGWRSFAEATGVVARRTGALSVVGDNRMEVAALVYYLRDSALRVLIWPDRADAENHYERTVPLTETERGPVLLVTQCPNQQRLQKYYRSVTPAGSFDARSGPTTFRRYFAFELSGSRGPIGPAGKCF